MPGFSIRFSWGDSELHISNKWKRSSNTGAPVLPAHYIIYAGFLAGSGSRPGEIRSLREQRSQLKFNISLPRNKLLLPPVAILLAIGLHGLYECWRLRKIAKAIIAIVMLLMLSLNIFGVYATIYRQERYMGYFWLYRVQGYRAARWVKTVLCDGTVACDVKIAYILKCYFNLRVDEFQGLKYLNGEGNQPRILFTYDQMIKKWVRYVWRLRRRSSLWMD